MKTLLLTALVLAGGCYLEASGGLYTLSGASDVSSDKAYSVGFAAGWFLDPAASRFALAYGGDRLVAKHEDPDPTARRLHSSFGLHVRVDPTLVSFGNEDNPHRLALTLGYSTSFSSSVCVRYDDGDDFTVSFPGVTQSFFGGLTTFLRFGTYLRGGVALSLGPAVMHTWGSEYGQVAWGGQARLVVEVSGTDWWNFAGPVRSIGGTPSTGTTESPGARRARELQELHWRNQGFTECGPADPRSECDD